MKARTFVGMFLIMAFATSASAATILTIEFDNFPNETAFGMWETASAPTGPEYEADPGLALDGVAYNVGASSPIGFGDGFVLPEDFDGEPPNVPFTFQWDLAPGGYTFIILDTFGDGICCGFGAGSYSLSAHGVEVGAGGGFAEFEVTQFKVGAKVPEPMILGLFGVALAGLGIARRRFSARHVD